MHHRRRPGSDSLTVQHGTTLERITPSLPMEGQLAVSRSLREGQFLNPVTRHEALSAPAPFLLGFQLTALYELTCSSKPYPSQPPVQALRSG